MPRGRPPKPLNPDASAAAKLGYELREWRMKRDLTQAALAARVGRAPQHVSEVERAKVRPSALTVQAWDKVLETGGELAELHDAAVRERDQQRERRADARREQRAAERLCPRCSALPCVGPDGDTGDDDVEPTTRLELIEAGAATALGAPALGAAPARAGAVDPGLVDHWLALRELLSGYDQTHGAREVLGVVQRELRVIAEYREAARGALRVELMRVEGRWAEFGAWLAHDCGDARSRDALLDHALHLAREADYPDLIALSRDRQAQFTDAPLALRLAAAGLRTPRASPQARAVCAGRVAHAHARIGDAESAQRVLDEVAQLISLESAQLTSLESAAPWSRTRPIEQHRLAAWEARCWLALDPRKAVALFDKLLRDWPHTRLRDGGLHQGRLALACAHAGELDRARAEGAKAFKVYKHTQSATATRELRQLNAMLKAA